MTPIPEDLRRSSLEASVKDGFAYSLMQGFGERNIQPFATFVGMSEGAWGLLASFSALAAGLFQVLGANVVDYARRRRFFYLLGAVVQACSFLLVVLCLYVGPGGKVALLILSQVVYNGAVHFTIPSWNSVMGELVPGDRRGRYFGFRNFLCGGGQAVSFIASALLLDAWQPLGLAGQGFLLLFVGSLLFRFQSTYYLSRMHEPVYAVADADRFTLMDFLRRAPRANFARFVFYVTAVFFGVAVAGPFFGYYMLKDLHWSFTDYMIALNIQAVALFATQPFWGRAADRGGNKRVLVAGGIGIGLIPLFWLLSANKWFLFAVQAYDGVAWSAFQMGFTNYLLEAVTAPKRARCTAYFNLLVFIGVFLGGLVGAALNELAPPAAAWLGVRLASPFTILLVVSTVGRLAPSLLMLRTFRELRVDLAPVPESAPGA